MNPYHHAQSSAARHGGRAEDYLSLHQWFDESKAFFPDVRHRALRHHAEGIFMAERIFGPVITNSAGREVPTRVLGEQHVKEDLGRIPTVQDWFVNLAPRPWMMRVGKLLYCESADDGSKQAAGKPDGTRDRGTDGSIDKLDGVVSRDELVDFCRTVAESAANWAACSDWREARKVFKELGQNARRLLARNGETTPTDGERCDCELPGHFCSGVPGILAHLENGRLEPEGQVERCDLCLRYESDAAALEKLRQLGHA